MKIKPLVPVNFAASRLPGAVTESGGDGAVPEGAASLAPESAIAAADITAPEATALNVWEQENYQLSTDDALSLGFSVATVDDTTNARVIVFGDIRYTDLVVNNEVYRFGVAIRAVFQLFATDVKAKFSVPSIAAQVELGLIDATCSLVVAGYTGNLSQVLPGWQSFDVKSYTQYFNTLTKLQQTVLGDTPNITPILLATTSLHHDVTHSGPPRKPDAEHRNAWQRFLHRDDGDGS